MATLFHLTLNNGQTYLFVLRLVTNNVTKRGPGTDCRYHREDIIKCNSLKLFEISLVFRRLSVSLQYLQCQRTEVTAVLHYAMDLFPICPIEPMITPGDGMAPIRREAITCNNDDPIYCRTLTLQNCGELSHLIRTMTCNDISFSDIKINECQLNCGAARKDPCGNIQLGLWYLLRYYTTVNKMECSFN